MESILNYVTILELIDMITDFLQQFTGWFVEHGYLGVFLATLGLFPAEIVIALFAAVRPNEIFLIAIVACLGEVAGSIPTYLIGYIFNEEKVYTWLNGKGKFLGIKQINVEKSVNQILKRGFFYVMISRLLPWIRIAAALAAGFMEMKIIPFMLATFIGTFLYAFPIAYLGARVGENWNEIQRHLLLYNKWAIATLIGYILVTQIIRHRKTLLSILNNRLLKKN